VAWGLFLKSPKTFRGYLGCHNPLISSQRRGCKPSNFVVFLAFLKPGFHIVVSVVSVVRKKFIGQIQLHGNLPHKRSIQKKRQIQLAVRDRMNSLCPMIFFSYNRHDRYNDMETRLYTKNMLKDQLFKTS